MKVLWAWLRAQVQRHLSKQDKRGDWPHRAPCKVSTQPQCPEPHCASGQTPALGSQAQSGHLIACLPPGCLSHHSSQGRSFGLHICPTTPNTLPALYHTPSHYLPQHPGPVLTALSFLPLLHPTPKMHPRHHRASHPQHLSLSPFAER